MLLQKLEQGALQMCKVQQQLRRWTRKMKMVQYTNCPFFEMDTKGKHEVSRSDRVGLQIFQSMMFIEKLAFVGENYVNVEVYWHHL